MDEEKSLASLDLHQSSNYDPPSEVCSPQSNKKAGQCLLPRQRSGEERGNHKYTPVNSNRSYSDNEPRIPRIISEEEDSEKRSLEFSNKVCSNDEPRRSRLSLGQKASLPVHVPEESGCFDKVPLEVDLEKSKVLIIDLIREEVVFERNRRAAENIGLTSHQIGLSLVSLKDCKREKTRKPPKKAHNVLRLNRVLVE
ncbi:hypothetical protein Ancab_034053 [Ancistrocladus abbreviatus]